MSREIVTDARFPHGLSCAECETLLPAGSTVCFVPIHDAGVLVPVVPLAEVYADGGTPADIDVALCEACAASKPRRKGEGGGANG